MVAVSIAVPMPTKNPRVVVYLSPELKAQLEVLADKQNRSVSNLLETLAREAIEEAKKSGVLP
jgi:predicted transcriptional regulator